MAKSLKLTVTPTELDCITDLADTIEAMKGCGGDFEKEARKNLRAFDRMLKRNGFSRK